MKRIKQSSNNLKWLLANLDTHYIVAWNDVCESSRNSYVQGIYITTSYKESENKSDFLLRNKKKDIQITSVGPNGVSNNIIKGRRVINIDDSSYFKTFKTNKVIWITSSCNCQFHKISKDYLK